MPEVDLVRDVVVLGGGSGGYATALRASQLGLTVALVEADRVGGTCLHRGCVPTKAMLHSGEVADAVRHAASVGVLAQLDGVDLPAVTAYRDGVVGRLHRGLTGLLRSRAVDVVAGHGRVAEVTSSAVVVEVDGRRITGRHLVLATGSRPRWPSWVRPGPRVIDSDGALALTAVPARLAVIGGGVIGVEMASLWRSLGAEVLLVEAADRLVPAEEPTVSAALAKALRVRGITVVTGGVVGGVTESADDVVVEVGGEAHTVDVVIVAVGREPVSDGLGLEDAGVRTERGYVEVDERLLTSVPRVWAVGDLVAGYALAHRAFGHGIAVAERIAGTDPVAVPEHHLPRVTYSDPEIASVGLTTAAAQELHGAENVTTATYPLGGNARSQILGTTGFVHLVRLVDGPVLGVHAIGSRMGEQIGEAQLLVGWEAHPEDVVGLIHAHPTQNEALGEAALALAGKPLHAHS
ncbi:dihydrolipoyl dehydrogenase [Serinibacter arcticus]|uniref:Dihydrolipoyl dehydrogenase n=1 Tax=Serinibacter arcticus TaxID=1655435 RepID=A0A2U1ZS99_9MICO|nr:dihydrolipoyl dehydrogenase [Serinibacter arcticus]PWD49864.1 dihydrolipoyl dehydrogenase [Serinibacter arcticus]